MLYSHWSWTDFDSTDVDLDSSELGSYDYNRAKLSSSGVGSGWVPLVDSAGVDSSSADSDEGPSEMCWQVERSIVADLCAVVE